MIIWRMGAGFKGLSKDISWLISTNAAEHRIFNKRLDAHSDKIDKAADAISAMQGSLQSPECIRDLTED
jgi:hypothetical protein